MINDFEKPEQKRVFLRIPARIHAALYLEGKFYKKVKLIDLSTRGVAFFIDQSEAIGDNFELRFRLKHFSRLIRVKVDVKNSSCVSGGLRIGCAFREISDKDRENFDKYISNFINISFPVQVVSLAAFLCAIDVSWRLLLYSVDFYYSATEFARNFNQFIHTRSYAAMLGLYGFFAFSALIFSSPRLLSKGKINFLLSLFFLGCIFIFLLVKNAIYWTICQWHYDYFLVSVFLWIQLLIVFYVGFAILAGILFLKKITFTLDTIKQHLAAFIKFRFMRYFNQQIKV